MTTLEDVASGRDNNFNLIRVIAASCVLISHAFPIALGPSAPQPAQEATGYTLGAIAVFIFFAISGFLISRSYDRSGRIMDWIGARIARLFPALIVVTIITAFVLGPLVTAKSVATYFSDPATYSYVPRNVMLVKLQFDLPGVFLDNPYPVAINGSLWTLFHEVACYLIVLIIGVAGVFRLPRVFGIFAIAWIIFFILTAPEIYGDSISERIASFRLLSFPFVLGIVFYVYRKFIILHYGVFLLFAIGTFVLSKTAAYEIAFFTTLSYGTFVLAFLPAGIIRRYNALGDYSYGIYVYAFPVQQLVAYLAGEKGMDPLENMLLSAPVVLLCAILSWYLVERPALDRRQGLVRFAEHVLGVRIS